MVNVIGLSSLLYFFHEKTPERAGADLGRLIEIAAEAGAPILVGGYSFGADVAPYMIEQSPTASRERVRGEILVAPSPHASFKFDVFAIEWMPGSAKRIASAPATYPVADAVRRLGLPAFCMTGLQVAAKDTPCASLADVATVVKLPGDHHFNADYAAVGKAVMAFIEKHF